MIQNDITQRIIHAVAKLTKYKNEDFYVKMFSDGSGVLIYSSYQFKFGKPDWCKYRSTDNNHEFRVFEIYDWNIEDAFVDWYEKHFEKITKTAKFYSILNLVEQNIF